MDKFKIVSILEFYKNIDEEIRLNKEAIEDIEMRYYNPINGVNMDGMPKGKGGTSNPTENTALNVPEWASEQLQELQAEQKALYALKRAIRKELERLPYIQRVIVSDFYIRGDNWVRISAQIHYSERQCKNIRNNALVKLGRRFASNKAIVGHNYPQ